MKGSASERRKLFEQYADNEKVDAVDGGTQGYAAAPLQQNRKLLTADATWYGAVFAGDVSVMNRFRSSDGENSVYIRPV